MASPSTRTPTRVEWRIQLAPVQGHSLPIVRRVVYLYFGTLPPGPQSTRETCWLDTGAPLSVVPFHVHHQRLVWQPLGGITTTWSGQPCDLGRIDFWLATDEPPFLRGPLSLLAKFPRSDPLGQRVPVLLGLEFLLTHQAELELPPPSQHGVILLP